MRPSSLLGVLFDYIDDLEENANHPADVRLSKFFRKRRYLGSKDRRFVGDAAYAWIGHRIRGETRWRLFTERTRQTLSQKGRVRHLGSLLAIAGDGLFPWPHNELSQAARTFAAPAGGGWVAALDRIDSGEFVSDQDWPEDPVERLAAECSLPKWLADCLVEMRGMDDARALGMALLEPAPVDLRVQLSRTEREVIRSELEETYGAKVEVTPWSPAGLRLRNRVNLQPFLRAYADRVQVQEEGSQLAALAASPAKGESIIEACAGNGGKLLAMADLTGGEAKFHAADIDASKLAELMRRAEPLGLASLTLHSISPTGELPRTMSRQADLVFVDAPCSGLGSLRRNPDLKTRYEPADIRDFAKRQLEILHRFASRVKPGGRLVYVTCSVLREENESVAERFLEKHPEFTAVAPALAERLPPEASSGAALRLDPVTTGTDGFYIALFTRGSD